jgi:hypothetical protein
MQMIRKNQEAEVHQSLGNNFLLNNLIKDKTWYKLKNNISNKYKI